MARDKIYATVDKDGSLWLHNIPVTRGEVMWEYPDFRDIPNANRFASFMIPKSMLPNLTWEDDPVLVFIESLRVINSEEDYPDLFSVEEKIIGG